MDMHTYCFLVMKAEEINLTWEADCATKYQSIVGNLTPPHAFGYWLRINSQCINIVVDGGGVLEVSDFVYLFNIEAGSTGVVIQNCRFDNYTNLGPIDVGATFTNNYFNGILYANGHP